MSEPKISVVATAARPNLWKQIYDNYNTSKIEFEMVFVGPNPPDYELPSNFRYIKTHVKPAQCAYIAAVNACGEILHLSGDDIAVSDGLLDKIYETYQKSGDYKVRISPRFYMNGGPDSGGTDATDTHAYLIYGHANTPLSPKVGCAPSFSRRLFDELGGYDTRFVASCNDLDFAVRAHLYGSELVYMEGTFVYELPRIPSYSPGMWTNDYGVLHGLWVDPQKVEFITDKRGEVNRYEMGDDILTVSQGPNNTSRWS